ncbi:hypothetical protein, partial [Candidatus Binatus sp.]|uniref:hypothetical protein n=1 Tax=Candidatus Binatus sp. TaxID=2811406 RepID=UPI003C3DF197
HPPFEARWRTLSQSVFIALTRGVRFVAEASDASFTGPVPLTSRSECSDHAFGQKSWLSEANSSKISLG